MSFSVMILLLLLSLCLLHNTFFSFKCSNTSFNRLSRAVYSSLVPEAFKDALVSFLNEFTKIFCRSLHLLSVNRISFLVSAKKAFILATICIGFALLFSRQMGFVLLFHSKEQYHTLGKILLASFLPSFNQYAK